MVRDVEWLVRADHAGDCMARFVCTIVVDPMPGEQSSS